MKKTLILSLLLLTACNPEYKQRMDACNSLSLELGKPDSFKNECAQNDVVYAEAYEESLHKSPPAILCRQNLMSSTSASSHLATQIAKKRGINCTPLHVEASKIITSEVDATALCFATANGWGNDILRKANQAEVKKRGLNCSQIVAAETQAAAAREQAQAARMQAWAASQAAMNANRARTTNCNSYGYGVSCTTY